ncbi:MAG: UDP-glucose dehydrogenase family protein [Isosphaeraceae bacterium]
MNVCVIGLWHQGIVGAACLADLGGTVVAADHDASKVALLNGGKAPLFEPGLDELIGKGLAVGRLRFSTEVARSVQGCPYVLIMFDTPVNDRDESDLSGVFSAAAEIAPHLEDGVVLYVTAQVPVGSCDRIAQIVREGNPSLRFGIAYSPENLRLGQAIDRFLHPPLPVIGADDPATLDRLEPLLAPLGVKWVKVGLRTAEMTKHALNAFLATSICFANELGNLCDEVGADGNRIAEVLRLEPRIGPKAMLFPGLGFAGGTLARDMQTLRSLGDRSGLETPLLDGAWDSNQQQNRLVLRKLEKAFGSLSGVQAAVLGLTYKPDTSTLRRSASLEIIADMVRAGMRVSAHDPKADRAEVAAQTDFRFVEDVYGAVEGADVLVLITAWPEYKALDFARVRRLMSGSLVIDTANMLDAPALQGLGFQYFDIGRGRGFDGGSPASSGPHGRV